MPEHIAPGTGAGVYQRRKEHATGKPNPNYVRRKLPVRKVNVASVPDVFNADAISRNGRVWAGFSPDERVVCVAATADECRLKWRVWEGQEMRKKTEERQKS